MSVKKGDIERRFRGTSSFSDVVADRRNPRAYGACGVLHLAGVLCRASNSVTCVSCCRHTLCGRVLSDRGPIRKKLICFAPVHSKRCEMCSRPRDYF